MTNNLTVISDLKKPITQNIPSLLAVIRPQWQSKNLIERVKSLLEVDPSSACQRLLNAAIHDLREKIIIAGVDIAGDAAQQNKLPPIVKSEDLDNYSNSKTLELAYRMGLLSRPEYRKMSRCYEIRRDLEHEDDEYEAGVEDVIYIFKNCIEIILSRDPMQLVRVADFKDLVEQPTAATPDDALLEDFEQAPQSRQEDIGKFLISMALDKSKADLVQQNAYNAIQRVAPLLQSQARANLGTSLQNQVGRQMNDRQAKVASASGLMPYIRQAAKISFFTSFYAEMKKVGTDWSAYSKHSDLLSDFEEYGGFDSCPPDQRDKIIRWCILTYIGTPGGLTSFGNIRNVYYSNSAAPHIKRLISESKANLKSIIEILRADATISKRIENKHIARRFEELLDIVGN